ncbi:hypothetical protein [Solilutibacter pythonis]|nr:hypothetical protein [Lysobacter pythonis]
MKKTASRFMLAASVLSHLTAKASDPPNRPIYNAMEISMQSCSVDARSIFTMHAHPQREAIWSNGMLPVGETGYLVDFNTMADYRDWTAMTRLHSTDRGVDDSYVLLTRDGMPPFTAAYVVTRLPESMHGNPVAVLSAVIDMQKTNANGHAISFIRTSTPLGEGLEMITGGRLGSLCFPTSHFVYATTPGQAAVEISRFVVRDDDLIEYALSLPVTPETNQSDMIIPGQRAMDRFQQGLWIKPRS